MFFIILIATIVLVLASIWLGRQVYFYFVGRNIEKNSTFYDEREMEWVDWETMKSRSEARWADGEDDDFQEEGKFKEKLPHEDRLPWYRGWTVVTYPRDVPQEAPRWLLWRYLPQGGTDAHPENPEALEGQLAK